MNWYKKLLAAPLPESDNFTEDLYDPKFRGVNTNQGWKDKVPYGIIGIDEALEEYKDDRIVDYVGAGTEGIAYELDNGNVLKVTMDPSEYEVAQELKGKPTRHIVNVYDYATIQDDFEEVWSIEIEKVAPLSEQELQWFDVILSDITQGRNREYESEELQKMHSNISSLVKEVQSYGYGFNDVTGHNVGKRGEDYVVLDLGGLNENGDSNLTTNNDWMFN